MSSSNNSAAPSRLYSVRLARWLFRLVWNRFVGWTLVCLISLTVLYYQWENRRSARELAAAHQRLLARVGTDDLHALSPPQVRDEQNYFAQPVVEQWADAPLRKGSPYKRYNVPDHAFLPAGFKAPNIIKNEADGTSSIDFASWATGQDLQGEPAPVVMNRLLGDANGLLPSLAAGLSRPFSALKPSHRELLEAAGDNFYEIQMPFISMVSTHLKDLGLHLRCAAAAGDGAKARPTALVLLRLFPESAAAYPSLVSALISLATHDLAFEALQDALGRPVWDPASLHALQMQLGKINDLEMIDTALSAEMLWGFGGGIHLRRECANGNRGVFTWAWGNHDHTWQSRLVNFGMASAAAYGPIGWHDANLAFYLERQLDVVGPRGETTWLGAAQRSEELKKRILAEYHSVTWNPRRYFGAIALPNIGNIFYSAAEMLFHRRCLIIACALEKHRLEQGSYPASLDTVRDDLRPFQVADPARPPQLPGYRVEKEGYVIWSAGPDAKDDGGVKDKDWLWRIRQAEP